MALRVEIVPGIVTSELRRAVLRPGWAPGTPMHGDTDPAAVHVAALAGDTVLGACLLLPNPCPHHPDEPAAWQLRGMATEAARRGQGIGAAVLDGAVTEVRRRGGTLLWCKARVTAVPFYAAHGFALDSAEYVEPETGLLHRDMSLGAATSLRAATCPLEWS